MTSGFPGALDTFAVNKQDDTDAKSGADLGLSTTTGDHATHHNDLADAVNKIEAELGIDPAGLYAVTVRERFEQFSFKGQSVKLASTANVAGAYANGTAGAGATKAVGGTTLTVDGIAVANGDRVLLKDQTTAFENGIYTASGVGTSVVLTRAIDADLSAKIADIRVLVDQGTLNADTEWGMVATAPTMGTTALPFRRTMPFYGHGNPRFPWDPGSLTSQVIAATLPRTLMLGTLLMTTTQTLVGGIVVPAGRTVTNVNLIFTTVGATYTISHMALIRQSDRLTLAHTANSTTVPTINAITTRALTGTWTPSYDTPIWVMLSFNASTMPVLAASPAGTAAVNLITPAMAATNAAAASSTVPTDNTTVIAAASAGVTNIPYLWLT